VNTVERILIINVHTMRFIERMQFQEHHKKMIMTIIECAWSMKLHVRFPLQFWVDVVDTVVYLINKGPSSSLDSGIPEEVCTGKQVNYSFMNTFGCEVFVHIDKENRTNIEEKSKQCTFIG
jgi:hypothetical protein